MTKEYMVRVWADGNKEWFLNDLRHREDGPAFECADGYKEWFLNDKLHREDGPAVEGLNGYKAWYLNGEELTEAQFNERMKTKPAKSCTDKIIEIDGVKYRLIPL